MEYVLVQEVANLARRLVDNAVSERFPQLTIQHRSGDYCYDDRRCSPDELGWRFRQRVFRVNGGPQLSGAGLYAVPTAAMPDEIRAGKWDAEIEATLHDAASAAWFYRYEKEYGRDEQADTIDEFCDE